MTLKNTPVSSLYQEIRALDPEITPRMVFNRLFYALSTIAPYEHQQKSGPSTPQSIGFFSSKPARYFSKGALEKNKKKNPTQIPYLITETHEDLLKEDFDEEIIEDLQTKGVLRQNKNGLVYLDVNNEYVHRLFAALEEENITKPPYFNIFGMPDGAHIGVILHREFQRRELAGIKELGKEFPFEVKNIFSLKPNSWQELEKVWILEVFSPALEELRESYHLSPKLGGNNFYVLIAVKLETKEALKQKTYPTMRINSTYQTV